MGERNQILNTICIQTKDAVEREEGRFVFNMPGDAPRMKAIKVSLGSLEFPMTQWTIEEDWNRLFLNEGHLLLQDANTISVSIRHMSDANMVSQHSVSMPVHLNEIEEWEKRGDRLHIHCTEAHNLWTEDGRSLLPFYTWASPRIIAGPYGRLSLHSVQRDLVKESDTEFSVPLSAVESSAAEEVPKLPRAGFLHAPRPPSLQILCQVITACARNFGLSLHYMESTNHVRVDFSNKTPATARITLHRTNLSTRIGVGMSDRSFDLAPGEKHTLPGTEQCCWWDAASLRPGWYGPSHRSMCPGPPRRLVSEMEMSLNRLTFPPAQSSEALPQGAASPHFIIFVDPSGATLRAPIPSGRYSADALCGLLQGAMMQATTAPNVRFRVWFDMDRFGFSCVYTGSDEVDFEYDMASSPQFALLFNHPMSIDPERLGFDAMMYSGSSSYVSPRGCRCVSSSCFPESPYTPLSNSYRVSDVAGEGRLRMHATPTSPLVGVIIAYDQDTSILHLQTFFSQLPYAHGFCDGDVVLVSKTNDGRLTIQNEDGEWLIEQRVQACDLAPACERTAVVMERRRDGDDDVCMLSLRTRFTPQLASCVGQCVNVTCPVRPFNLCVGLPRSLPSRILGFPEGATQWGVNGIVLDATSGWRLPPFDAPALHNMDHPDYILVYLDEGKRTTSLQHSNGTSLTTPLCKLVLYPSFREERMLPRETGLVSGESLSRFTLRFTNPDGSRYHFHNVDFSFSLNLLKVSD